MTETLLRIDKLEVEFRRRWRSSALKAIDDVTLRVARREIVGLVGESGSGKSTLSRALLGLTPATAGTIRFDGHDITHERAEKRRTGRALQVVSRTPTAHSIRPGRSVASSASRSRYAAGYPQAKRARKSVTCSLAWDYRQTR